MTTQSDGPGAVRDDEILTKEELRVRMNLPSTRMVDELVKKRKIPCLKWGHRTVRFEFQKVREALGKFEVKAVGSK